jgi:hypothetical protein
MPLAAAASAAKVGNGFPKTSCPIEELKPDDDSTKSLLALD